jgi:hypothetical protein
MLVDTDQRFELGLNIIALGKGRNPPVPALGDSLAKGAQKSRSLMMPTTRPASSQTGTELTECFTRSPAISFNVASGGTVTTFRVMISLTRTPIFSSSSVPLQQ